MNPDMTQLDDERFDDFSVIDKCLELEDIEALERWDEQPIKLYHPTKKVYHDIHPQV